MEVLNTKDKDPKSFQRGEEKHPYTKKRESE